MYAVIITHTGIWELESDDLDEAKRVAAELRKAGTECVIVQVIDDGETIPDIFDDI